MRRSLFRACTRRVRCPAQELARESVRRGREPEAMRPIFPSGSIVQHTYGVQNTTTCTFSQDMSGALDSARDLMRFGLMTFDQDPSPGIGVTSGSDPQVLNSPFVGMWSYFPGWNTGAACTYYGNPVNCTAQELLAVGARNPAAPPWEGRMMLFPSTNDITAQEQRNDQIQQVILSTRPYGATPLAGMMKGALEYFWNDPTGPQQTDGYVQGKCRNEYILVVTDGAPNLDLQPSCRRPTGSPRASVRSTPLTSLPRSCTTPPSARINR